MPEPGPGFQADVTELEEIATVTLPHMATIYRAPIAVLSEHTRTERPAEFAEVTLVERAYAAFTEDIATQQRKGVQMIEETAAALREVAALYRRVDGQG